MRSLLDKFYLLQIAKCLKIIKSSGHTDEDNAKFVWQMGRYLKSSLSSKTTEQKSVKIYPN